MTTVTKQVTTAQVFPNNIIGQASEHTNWLDLEYIGESDNLYAVADFADFVGDNVSNFLHMYTFGFDLPEEITVDGIEIIIEKKATGSVQDLQVRLSWNDTSIRFTTPAVDSEDWENTDSTSVYGGADDPWNEQWTSEDINSTNFGVIIAAIGTTDNSAAFIDTAWISVSYHAVFNEVGNDTGGCAECGGTATVDVIARIGGTSVGGHATMQFDDIATGGMQSAGLSPYVAGLFSEGGVLIAGESPPNATYGVTSSGGALTGGLADPDFIDEISTSGGIKLGGTAPMTASYYGIGGAVVSGIATLAVHNIVASGGVGVRGAASDQRICSPSASGGVVLSGSYTSNLRHSEIASGGVNLAGTWIVGIGWISQGGVQVAGDVVRSWVFNPVISGGATLAGLHSQTFIDYIDMGGGVCVSPKSKIQKISPAVTSRRLGVGRSLESSNILNTTTTESELIQSTSSSSVGSLPLDPNRFRIVNLPSWCEILPDKSLSSKTCDAGVPKVVINRQRLNLPPQDGRQRALSD